MKNNSSSPLHTTEVNITFKDYKMYVSKVQSKAVQFIELVSKLIVILSVLFGMLIYFINFSSIHVVTHIFVLFAVPLLYLIFTFRSAQLKKEFKSNKLLNNNRLLYQFHDDHLEILNLRNENEILRYIPYTNLYNIIENKKHFYLMASKLTGTILPRRFCNIELTKFLEELNKEIKNSNNN